MKKHILHWSSATFLLITILLLLIPYFSTGFLDLRQQEENEKEYERILDEQRQAEEAVERAYLTGKFDPRRREGFITVPAQYTLTPNTIYLRKETYESFLKMRNAAEKDNISLKISSATRNFSYQKILWDNKWTGVTYVDGKDLSKSIPDGSKRFQKILEYSAAPGTSRHHWGTEIDINAAIPSYFNEGKGEEEYEWLVKNAKKFGFCQTYDLKGSARPTGYNEEKWHWSYLPLARDLTRKYKDLVKPEDILGFQGDQYAVWKDLMNDYVQSINQDCL